MNKRENVMSWPDEFTSLVHDFKSLLIEEMREGLLPLPQKAPLKTVSQPIPVKSAAPQIAPPPLEVKIEEVKTEISPPLIDLPPISTPQEKESPLLFERIPLPPIEEKSLEKIEKYVHIAAPKLEKVEPYIPILFILPKEIPEHRQFAENVVKAISQSIAPASVTVLDGKKSLPLCQLALAPRSILKKAAQAPLHQPFDWSPTLRFLPLADLDAYLQDPQLKRTLWNSLKALHFPFSPRSSST